MIYVFAGKNDSLVNAQCQEFLQQLIEPSQRATGLFVADAGEVSVADVLDELRTVPFLTPKRVVVVKNADEFISQNRPLLEKYFDNPCRTGQLILTVRTWDARTKLAKKLPEVGKLIEVKQPPSWQLPGRLSKYAGDAHDKRLDKDAAELLIELTGDDLPRLYSEIDKLAVFADAEKVITAKHVESLIGYNRIYGAFEVIDAMVAGKTAEAIARLRNMFAEDKNAEYTVVGAFAFHFRRMYHATVLLEKGTSTSEVAKRLRIWANIEGFFAQVRKMTLPQLSRILSQLGTIDYAIKTGQTKAQVAIEQLVLDMALG
ncbi:MAG: DNA polymerase III subunit delta [Sedimentisphaerales bacterium]|nr:DNA polymerase III subunit delta [Sedimentisphaerales bacterium]